MHTLLSRRRPTSSGAQTGRSFGRTRQGRALWRHMVASLMLAGAAALIASSGAIASDPVVSEEHGPAHAARTMSLHEAAKLHLVHHSHGELVESGNSSGTFDCPVQITVKLGNNTASLGYRLSCAGKGTFNGNGTASYYVAGSVARINGRLTLAHGTGQYSHAVARNLSFAGTMQRGNYQLSATVTGSWTNS